MNYRQVHLDFHTSEKIEGIGEAFDKAQFQEMLKLGHVNSITVFSKCHHGWAYHPSKANQMHPHLKFDLLGAQIEAAHEIGVKTPVYLSAGLDEKYARTHREHLVRAANDSVGSSTPDFMRPGYHKMCLNTPYLDILLDQIREVCENYDADGIFLDIVCVQPCYCQTCMTQLEEEGGDPNNFADVMAQAERVYANYVRRVRETIDSVKPGLPVFHNGGHIRRGRRDLAHANTHLELESLPTGGWGYDHFPMSAAYSRTLGMNFLGMTGKFHTSWGEFGGYKHPNALRYEVALSAATGAHCSVGDQLHPSGRMDPATYSIIGAGYRELEVKEPWLDGYRNKADIAVLSIEALNNYYEQKMLPTVGSDVPDKGCARILLEGHYLFDYIDTEANLDGYKLLILPDTAILDAELAEKIKAYVRGGGKVLASGRAATLDGSFAIDFGCEYAGASEFRPDYVRPHFDIGFMPEAACLMRCQGYRIKNVRGQVLADREDSYFNRTREHFCSHQHAPNNTASRESAVVMGADGAYIGWDVFEEYATSGIITAKALVIGVLEALLPNKQISTNLGAQGVVTLTEKGNSEIVHLLYAPPIRRGNGVEIIEDLPTVCDTTVSVKCAEEPASVRLVPDMKEIPFTYTDGKVTFEIDRFVCHQMIEILK